MPNPSSWVFENEHIIGNGSFGVVYQATIQGSKPVKVRRVDVDQWSGLEHFVCDKTARAPAAPQEVAIKKVLQDKRFKVLAAARPP